MPRRQLVSAALVIVVVVAGAVGAQVVPIGDQGTGYRMSAVEAGGERIAVTVGEVRLGAVEVDGLSWAVVQAPGAVNSMARCLPSLPELATEMLLGDGDRVRLELESVREKAVDLTALGFAGVAPSKGHFTRDVDPETVPWCFDAKVYGEKLDWPAEAVARVDEPFIAGPVRGQAVRTPAARWSPSSNRLLVVEEAVYRVVREADTSNPRRRVAPAPNLAISYAAASRAVNGRAVVDGRLVEAGRAAFVVHDDFLDEVAPLVEWTQLVGHPVVVTPMSAIPPAGDSATAAEIQAYLQGLYNEPAGLTWIVLVGDHEQVPTLRGVYEDAHCDPCFAKLEGADHRLDAAVSRISAQTGEQVTIQVDKILGYERYPDAGSAAAWYGGAFGIAGDDYGGGAYDYERMDWLRVDLVEPAYLYTEFTQLYHSPTKAQVAAAVNDGRSLGLYIGHGSNTSWVTSGFSVSDVNSMLSNGDMLPVIWDVACVNGSFYLTSGDCFAEAWLKKEGGGAVSFEAATTNEQWVPPCTAQRGVIDALRLETAFTTGGQHLAGKMRVQDTDGDGDGDEGTQFVEQSHLFGSAMMWPRTAPPAIPDEPLDGQVVGGVASLTVTVGGQPLAVAGSAIVSFVDRSSGSPVVVGSGLVDENGHVEAAVTGAPTHCHIHGHNLAPTEYELAARPDGRLSLDAAAYACSGVVGLRVSDANVGAGQVTVTLAGPGGSSDVTLTEQPAGSGFYLGSYTLGGALPVSHGDLLTATYLDADDGAGGSGVTKTATAVVDCQGPVITGVQVSPDHDSAVLVFSTDELGSTQVEYWTGQEAPQVVNDGALTTDHQLELTGLDSCSQYSFRLSSVDALGNPTTADAVTADTAGWAVIASESLDADPGWARDGQWAWGTPSGSADPTSGHTGTTFFGYNHTATNDGDYPDNMARQYLTTSDFDVSEATSLTLRFWRRLGIESASWDHASVEASTDGGATWTVVWDHTAGTFTDAAWTEQVFDLSALLPAATVRVRWVMGTTDGSVTYGGWNLDDVTLEGAVPCRGPEVFADGFETGTCGAWSAEVGGP